MNYYDKIAEIIDDYCKTKKNCFYCFQLPPGPDCMTVG